MVRTGFSTYPYKENYIVGTVSKISWWTIQSKPCFRSFRQFVLEFCKWFVKSSILDLGICMLVFELYKTYLEIESIDQNQSSCGVHTVVREQVFDAVICFTFHLKWNMKIRHSLWRALDSTWRCAELMLLAWTYHYDVRVSVILIYYLWSGSCWAFVSSWFVALVFFLDQWCPFYPKFMPNFLRRTWRW